MPSEGPSSQEVTGRAAPVEGHGGSWAVAGLCGAGVALIGTVAALVLPGRILPRPASDAATDVVHTFQVVGVLAAVALGIVAGLAAASPSAATSGPVTRPLRMHRPAPPPGR